MVLLICIVLAVEVWCALAIYTHYNLLKDVWHRMQDISFKQIANEKKLETIIEQQTRLININKDVVGTIKTTDVNVSIAKTDIINEILKIKSNGKKHSKKHANMPDCENNNHDNQ